MKFLYHRFNWENASKKCRIKFTDDNGNSMRLYRRNYNGRGACYYIYSHVFPTLFIYSGNFINQLYDYCQTISTKCTSTSICAAFSESPNIYKLLVGEGFDNCHVEDVSIGGETRKCLAVCYPSFLLSKKKMYNRLACMEDTLREEVQKIKKEELKGKWDTLKKIGAGVLKVATRLGVALVAGAVGANLDIDIPDFGIVSSIPDMDYDFDMEFDDQMAFDTDLNNGYNISFGASENSDGYIPEGTISLERTISGGSDTFPHYTQDGHDYVKLGPGKYERIDQGITVNLKGVKYNTI